VRLTARVYQIIGAPFQQGRNGPAQSARTNRTPPERAQNGRKQGRTTGRVRRGRTRFGHRGSQAGPAVSPAVARRALVVCTVHGGRQQLGRSTVLPPALDRIGSSPLESSSPGPSRRSELAGSGDGMAARTTGCASASRGTPRDFGRIVEGSQRRSARRRSSGFASFQQERRRLETATAQRICRAGYPLRPCRCGLTRPPAPWLHAARLRFRPHWSAQETLHGDGLQPRRRSAAAGPLLSSDPGLLLPCPRWLARRERCRTSALVARSLLLP